MSASAPNKYLPKLVGFKRLSFNLPSEEMGKEFRDFCAEHYLTPQEVLAKFTSDLLIDNGISSGQPLPPIEALERLTSRYRVEAESDGADTENEKSDILEHPDTILFDIPSSIADTFVRHCFRKGQNANKVMASLIIDYLTAQGKLAADSH